MEIVPFKAEHIMQLQLQPRQGAFFYDDYSPEHGRLLEQHGEGYTAIVDGRPVACAGMVDQWRGRALAWALIGADAGPHFVRITRAVRRALDMAEWRRIEMQVDAEHGEAIRWARMLGFEVESKMRAFLPDGRDAFMFVRIR